MNSLSNRVVRAEKQSGIKDRPPAYGEAWWTCYARDGHQAEDIAEAARLSGVTVGPLDVVLVGFMDPKAPTYWPIPPMESWSVGGTHV
ncbi:hypothetical protein [Aureimonas jatrophae]|uniref:Uncharacterized protein n=1 Tax=Aureimonas jatrophae TaxID=1166073 RepID=A0A1H0FS74_9HYPH|nr:hypothetical protein [Aureimonas jatrophae]MBB3950478.1 hypothetical protein [Aureimonas jatrophae]SDN97402.1 hypothetical protein SAMN05192530_102646 [Aureimonas jatrophae]